MVKVTELSENDLREIGLSYANYIYPDDDKGMFPFDDKENADKLHCWFCKVVHAGGNALYNFRAT